jgi:tRNA (guanine37-N1)-methyltransferase
MINIRVLTIFTNIFESFLAYGNPARAIQMGLALVQPVDLRQFGDEPRRSTDDYPYGGGIGMIMKPEPIVRGIRSIEAHDVVTHKILLTPQGRCLKQEIVEELSHKSELLLICGRYEGIDERVRYFVNDENPFTTDSWNILNIPDQGILKTARSPVYCWKDTTKKFADGNVKCLWLKP